MRPVYQVLVVAGAGVVEQDVEAAGAIQGGLHGLLGGGFVAGIAHYDDRPGGVRSQLVGQGLEPLGAPGGQDELRAFGGQGAGARLANASAGAGDEGYFAREFTCHKKEGERRASQVA